MLNLFSIFFLIQSIYTRTSYFYNWIISKMVYGSTIIETTTRIPTASVTQPLCEDYDQLVCTQFKILSYCILFQSYMQVYCPVTCNFCSNKCADSVLQCPEYYTAGYCTNTYPSVLIACPVSCKLC